MDAELKKTLWSAADKLRSNMDAAEYKHLVLGLIFLKYISDAFVEKQDELARRFADPSDDYFIEDKNTRKNDLEDRDYYSESNVFWVPANARWERIREQAKQAKLGKIIDDALIEIENENPRLKGLLDKRFARTQLEPGKMGELVDLISKIGFNGDRSTRLEVPTSRDGKRPGERAGPAQTAGSGKVSEFAKSEFPETTSFRCNFICCNAFFASSSWSGGISLSKSTEIK